MTQYYVLRGTTTKPSSDVQSFWDYDRATALSLTNKYQTLSAKSEVLRVRNDRNDVDWQLCFTDDLQYQNFINECNFGSCSTETQLRAAYERSVGIVTSAEIIGYVDIPE